MLILGIETSCDETSASLISADKDKIKLISNIVASSLSLHAKTGGIIPEIAAREQLKFILPVIEKALEKIKNPEKNLDAIAVTVGPGLIGSLLVGVETARTLAYVWKKPLIPVNHLFGHIYANWLVADSELHMDKNPRTTNYPLRAGIEFPAIALVVSGGHTDLVLMKGHGSIRWLGGTRDDAAGEAFDKVGRLLSLPYPGGPHIEKMAEGVKKDLFNFPRPMINSDNFDFSFSGLKTAILREVEKIGQNNLSENDIKNLSYSLQNAIIDVLIKKTIKASLKYKAKAILLGGGVAANQTLRKRFELEIENLSTQMRDPAAAGKIPFFVPEKRLCTDNAAMIAAAGFFSAKGRSAFGGNKIGVPWQKITANPELYFD